jgi:sugar phosphate isomerase/epimerase
MGITLATIAPMGFGEFDDPAWLQAMGRIGCTSCQAYRNPAAGLDVRQMRNHLQAGALPCDSLHGLFGLELDPSSPDEDMRSRSVRTYQDEARLARDLGGDLVVVHCSAPRSEDRPDPDRPTRREQLIRSIEELSAFGSRIGVRYAWENLPPGYPIGSDAADLAALLRQLDLPATGMCFDTGHTHMQQDVADAFAACADKVIYLHLSDNHSLADEHLMPTEGTLDLDRLADAIAASVYAGPVMLEIFHPLARLEEMIRKGLDARLASLLGRAGG